MVSIETMACGVPVIWVDEWGFRETILANQTGYLINPEDLEQNLVEVIKNTNLETLLSMSKACREQSINFSKEKMIQEIQKFIF